MAPDQRSAQVICHSAGARPDLSSYRKGTSHLFRKNAVVQRCGDQVPQADVAIQGGGRTNRDQALCRGCEDVYSPPMKAVLGHFREMLVAMVRWSLLVLVLQ